MSANAIEELLFNLEKAIRKDKSYYNTILNDPNYQAIQPQIKSLRDKLFNQSKNQNEEELTDLYSKFEIEEIINLERSHKLPAEVSDLIRTTTSDLDRIHNKIKRNTYFDYLDNLEMLPSIRERLIQINNLLGKSTVSNEATFRDLNEQLKQEQKRLKITSNAIRNTKFVGAFYILLSIICLGLTLIVVAENSTDFIGNFGQILLFITFSLSVIRLFDSEYDDYFGNAKMMKETNWFFMLIRVLIYTCTIGAISTIVIIIVFGVIELIFNYLLNLDSYILYICLVLVPALAIFKHYRWISNVISSLNPEKKNIESTINRIISHMKEIQFTLISLGVGIRVNDKGNISKVLVNRGPLKKK